MFINNIVIVVSVNIDSSVYAISLSQLLYSTL